MTDVRLEPRLHRLALRLFFDLCPLSPREVYLYVRRVARDDEVCRPAVVTEELRTPFGVRVEAALEERGGTRDAGYAAHLLEGVSLLDVAPNLVQAYEGQRAATSLGYARSSFRFDTVDEARLALAVQARHTRGDVDDVLACLVRAVECHTSALVPCGEGGGGGDLRVGLLGRVLPPLRPSVHLEPRDGLVTSGTSQWSALTDAVACASRDGEDDADATTLTVLADGGGHAVRIVVVHAHWDVVRGAWEEGEASCGSALVHRREPECRLLFWRGGAPCAGVVELDFVRLRRRRPWWVSRTTEFVDSRVLCGMRRPREGCGTDDEDEDADVGHEPWRLVLPKDDVLASTQNRGTVRALPPCIEADDVPCDKKSKVLVEKWIKSARARHARIPFLVQPLVFVDDPGTRVSSDGQLWMERISPSSSTSSHVEEVVRMQTVAVFRDGFKEPYVSGIFKRLLDDPCAGICLVSRRGSHLEASTPVAAFAVKSFACIFADGAHGTALMIDSFAVSASERSSGMGSRVYEEFCLRGIGRRVRTSQRIFVFAQCIRTGEARKFWRDKLDDSSAARALMLQAVQLCPDRMEIHGEADCDPRAREVWF